MSLVVVNQGEEQMLDLILAVNYTLRLYKTDVTAGLTATQIDALDELDMVEATFSGYVSVALTGGSWTTTQGDPASTGTYAQQTFVRASTGADQTIYGYYVTRTSDGKLVWFEKFAGPITLTNAGDLIRVTPTFTLDDQEATVTARGVVGTPFRSTASSVAYGSGATTDFTWTGTVDSTRRYEVTAFSRYDLTSGPGDWLFSLHEGGTEVDYLATSGGNPEFRGTMAATVDWLPTTGSKTLDIRVTRPGGTGTVTFVATATTPRTLVVKDVGPR